IRAVALNNGWQEVRTALPRQQSIGAAISRRDIARAFLGQALIDESRDPGGDTWVSERRELGLLVISGARLNPGKPLRDCIGDFCSSRRDPYARRINARPAAIVDN